MARRSATAIDVEIGQRLRQARIRRDLSQAELGAAIGVTFQQVQKYEKGESRIALSTLAQLRSALQIEPADLLPTLRNDGDPIPDPLAALGSSIVGVQLARLVGRMRPDQQQSILEVAKVIISASAPTPAPTAA